MSKNFRSETSQRLFVSQLMDKFYACGVVLIIYAENSIHHGTKVDIHSLYYKFPNINLEIVATLKPGWWQ